MTRRLLPTRLRRPARRTASLSIQTLEAREVPAAFTEGNIVVVRVGDGGTALSGIASSVFLDEFTPSGTAVFTGNTEADGHPLPTAPAGSNFALTTSGNTITEGSLSLSTDGRYLVVAGYDAAPGTASVTFAAGIGRVVGRVDAAGAVNTTTRYADGHTGSAVRSVASVDGTAFWTAGPGGIRYETLGAASSTGLSSADARVVHIVGGQMYVSSGSAGNTGINAVGTGLPTTGGQSLSLIPLAAGSSHATNPLGFTFLDRDATIAGHDTLYVANRDGGLLKYSYDGSSWTARGSLTGTYNGIVGRVVGSSAELYLTSGTEAGNALVKFTDSAAYNGTISAGSPSTLAQAGTNQVFRGVAFAPAAAAANQSPVNTLPATFSTAEDGSITLAGVSVSDPDAGTANVQVTLSIPAAAGRLRVTAGLAGGVVAGQVTGSNTNVVTVTAPLAAINATFANAVGLMYFPATDFNGNVTLTMTTDDLGNTGSGGAKSDTDTATIVVTAVNDAPVVGPATFTVNQNAAAGTAVGTVAATDVENDTLTSTITAGNTGGAFAINPSTGQITVADGSAINSGSFALTVTVTDNGSPNLSGQATITVNVNTKPTVSAPIGDRSAFEDGAPIVIDLAPHFADAEDPDSALVFTVPGNSNPALAGVSVTGTTLTLTLAPDANGFGVPTVRATDPGGLFVETVFGVFVTAVNDAPTLGAIGNVSADEDAGQQTVNLTGIAGGPPDEASQAVTITAVSDNPALVPSPTVTYAGGTTGSLKFTPAANASGTATITVTAKDNGGADNGGADTRTRTFTLTVNPVNDPPALDPIDDVLTEEDAGEQLIDLTGLSAGPADETGQSLTITAVSDNPGLIPNPTVTYAGGPTGSLTFASAPDASGSATITVTVTDSGTGANTSVRTFDIQVDPVNDAPVVTDATFGVNAGAADGTVVGTVTATDLEADGLFYFIADGDPDGVFAIDPGTGAITVADSTFLTGGPFVLTVEVTDDGIPNETGSGTVTIDLNHPPTATGVNLDRTALEDSAQLTVDLATAFADPDTGDTLTYTIRSNSNPALFTGAPTITGTSVKVTPAADAFGESILRVRATDSGGLFVESTFKVVVTGVNDAPTFTKGANQGIGEDAGPQSFPGWATGISAGPANENGQAVAFLATTDNAALFAALPAVAPDGTLTLTPAADAFGSATVTVRVQDNGGTADGGVDTSAAQTFTISVGPVGDRPILNTALTPMLPPVALRTVPTGAAVGSLLGGFSDADPNAPRGMAVTAVDTAKGRWEFSTDSGASWSPIAGVSETSALLLADAPGTRVRFVPKPLFQGFANLTFKAWDQTNGFNQGLPLRDTTGAADGSYSLLTDRAWVAVGRTVPKVNSTGNPLLTPVKEDTRSPAGNPVRTVLGLLARELGATTPLGIAVTGASTTGGKWQFSTTAGRKWIDVGTIPADRGLVLRPADRLRFLPAANYDGEATVTYRTWNLAGTPGQQVPLTGTGFSAASETAIADVVPVNDRPVLDLSRAAVLSGPGPANAAPFGSFMSATDVEGAAVGVAVFQASGPGTWHYRPAGGADTLLPRVSAFKALLLAADTEVWFEPAVGAPAGTARLSFRAWDGSNGKAAGTLAPVAGTAFGQQVEVLTVAVGNTPPVLDNAGSPSLPDVIAGARPGAGALVRTLLGTAVTDADLRALRGIAVTGTGGVAGTWEYSLGLNKWAAIGGVTKDAALLLPDSARLRFVPAAGVTTGTATVSYKAWDRTAGMVGDRIDTDSGPDVFSLNTETASVTVRPA